MKIKTIDIDGFGVWNGLKIDDLADTATVVYGPNEAGKTTLMQFVRAVLYGFTPDRRRKYLPPVNGGRPGGRLLLGHSVGQFLAQRFASPSDAADDPGTITLVDDRGEGRDPGKLDDLLSGVDEPTYNNVFAIGLKEIQELGSLDETAAADYLYKLTSGLDRVSLIDVVREVATARERLLDSAVEEPKPGSLDPAQIPELLARRRQLKAQIEAHKGQTRRWLDVATLRERIADEAAQFERQIDEIEQGSLVLRAALDVQSVWNLRADLQRQLELLKDIRQLPDKAVEKLDACLKRIEQCQSRLKKLVAHRNHYRKELESLDVNRVLISHASRIEALHDQAQWVLGLENNLVKLREEVKKLDDEIDAAVHGYSKSAGGKNLDELPQETVTVLRRPAQVVREENEKLEKARQEADEAKRAFEGAVEQYETVGRQRQLSDLNQAIQDAGHKVSLLRRRIQVEERIDQLGRRREELEFNSDEQHTYEETPLRISALIGVVFSFGIALVGVGIFFGMWGWVDNGWPWALFGGVMCLLAGGGKLLLERNSEDSITDTHRHLDQLRVQSAEAKRERDEIDAELPTSNGSLDARLREAEIELRDLERLIPVRTERETAEQRHQAAQRKLSTAQDAVKDAKHRWRNALRSVGLPEDFAPLKVKQVVRNNAGVLDLRRRRDSRKDELDQKEREMMLLGSKIQQIVDDVRLPTAADKPLLKIRDLFQALTKEKETLATRTQVEKKIRRLVKERARTISLMRRADRRHQALLSVAGVNDDKAFRKAAADADRAAELKRQRDEQTLRIQQQLAQSSRHTPCAVTKSGSSMAADGTRSVPTTLFAAQFTEDAIAEVFNREGRDIRPSWDQRQKELADIRAKLGGLHERRGALAHEMQTLAADKSLSTTLQEVEAVEVELAAAIRRWKVLTIIGQVLEHVRQHYETDRQPQTLREASEYLHRLTDGHYRRVWMPLDHRNLVVENDKGESLSLELLSRGTREAVFIALRLALVTSFARRGTTLPLVLDDVLVNFDSGRVRAAAEVLCEFARTGHQIIMFTCHEHITDIFEDAQADVRVLPHRGGEVDPRPVKRRRVLEPVVELPPPPAPPLVPEPEPIRNPPIDPNPFFLQAAHEEQWFEDILELPAKERPAPAPPPPPPKAKKPKPPSRYKVVPRDWDRDHWPLASVAIAKAVPVPKLDLPDCWPIAAAPPAPLPQLNLPEAWPLAEVPAASPRVFTPTLEPFEFLAFRLPDAWPLAESPVPVAAPTPVTKIIVAPAEPTPPPPKHRPARPQRSRFTWESPEMYWEEATD